MIIIKLLLLPLDTKYEIELINELFYINKYNKNVCLKNSFNDKKLSVYLPKENEEIFKESKENNKRSSLFGSNSNYNKFKKQISENFIDGGLTPSLESIKPRNLFLESNVLDSSSFSRYGLKNNLQNIVKEKFITDNLNKYIPSKFNEPKIVTSESNILKTYISNQSIKERKSYEFLKHGIKTSNNYLTKQSRKESINEFLNSNLSNINEIPQNLNLFNKKKNSLSEFYRGSFCIKSPVRNMSRNKNKTKRLSTIKYIDADNFEKIRLNYLQVLMLKLCPNRIKHDQNVQLFTKEYLMLTHGLDVKRIFQQSVIYDRLIHSFQNKIGRRF